MELFFDKDVNTIELLNILRFGICDILRICLDSEWAHNIKKRR